MYAGALWRTTLLDVLGAVQVWSKAAGRSEWVAREAAVAFAPSSYPGVTIELPAGGSTVAPAEPEVTEDSEDFAQWRENIAANGGEPSSSAESQYLYACEQGTLPAADCP